MIWRHFWAWRCLTYMYTAQMSQNKYKLVLGDILGQESLTSMILIYSTTELYICPATLNLLCLLLLAAGKTYITTPDMSIISWNTLKRQAESWICVLFMAISVSAYKLAFVGGLAALFIPHSALYISLFTPVILLQCTLTNANKQGHQVGLGGTENFYLRWDGHAIIANIAMSGLIHPVSQIIDIIRVNCAKLRQQCVLGAHVAFAVP